MRKLLKYCLLLSITGLFCCDNESPSSTSTSQNDKIIGNGILIVQERSISDFSRIYLMGSYSVFIDSSSGETLKIEGEENILPHIKTEITGSVLKIYPDCSISYTIPLIISLKKENISGIDIIGKTTIECKKVVGKELEIDTEGEVDINLNGDIKYLNIDIDGIGNVNAKKLRTDSTKIDIKGIGKLKVFVCEYLNVNVNGIGEINYQGNPVIVKSIIGMGTITSDNP